jgi:hypothetical protein
VTRRDRIEKTTSRYTSREAGALLAPLLGMAPAEVHAFLVIGIGRDGKAGVGGSDNLSDRNTLIVLEALAAAMRARGVTTGP